MKTRLVGDLLTKKFSPFKLEIDVQNAQQAGFLLVVFNSNTFPEDIGDTEATWRLILDQLGIMGIDRYNIPFYKKHMDLFDKRDRNGENG